MMGRPCSTAGQATADYVALLAVIGALMAGAAAAGAPAALAPAVAAAVRHGICLVAGGVCTPAEARASGMEPCLVHARRDRERLAVRAVVVRLERGDALLVERRSDGSAAVSFLDGWRAGAEAGIGLRLPWAGDAALEGGAGAQFTGGRTWEFSTGAAAERFARRWSRRETVGGEARGLAHRLCPWCHGRPGPPPPRATYREGGAYGDFLADLAPRVPGLAVAPGLHEEAAAGAVAGRRVSGRRTTWYLRADAALTARLGGVIGALQRARQGSAGLEISLVDGRPVELRVRGAAAMRGQLELLGATTSLTQLSRRLRGATGAGRAGRGTGLGVEAEVSLDLTDVRNRRAAMDVLRMLEPGASAGQWDDRLRTLAERLDADGSVDVRILRVSASERETRAQGALGVQLGAGYAREEQTRELLRAWSLRRGGALHEREDCVSA